MKKYSKLTDKILHYYRENRRILPWREDPTAYHIWLSEIMLQQTRVDTVIPYFIRFIEAFPGIQELAEGSEEKLMKLWEGLGYYSRARNLQRAARIVMEKNQGKLPKTKNELMELPGIGSYTAGAIASIAFGQREAAVDGNLIRIGSRLLAYGESVTKGKGKKRIEEFWEELLPDTKAGDFNQGLMDIGATICLPNGEPLCDKCPLREECIAFQSGTPLDYPLKEPKKKKGIEDKTLFMIFDGREIAMEKRKNRGLLAGMWQFPMASGHLTTEEDALKWLKEQEFSPLTLRKGPVAKHIFSHKEWRMISWVVILDELTLREKEERYTWIKREEIDEITLPTAFRKFRDQVRENKG